MREIVIQHPIGINAELLDMELRGALGTAISGISVSGTIVRVHLAADTAPEQIAQARQVVQAHDATKRSPRQQAEAERKHNLEAARGANASPLQPADYAGQSDLVQRLARKIAWLEQEIADLRGL